MRKPDRLKNRGDRSFKSKEICMLESMIVTLVVVIEDKDRNSNSNIKLEEVELEVVETHSMGSNPLIRSNKSPILM